MLRFDLPHNCWDAWLWDERVVVHFALAIMAFKKAKCESRNRINQFAMLFQIG